MITFYELAFGFIKGFVGYFLQGFVDPIQQGKIYPELHPEVIITGITTILYNYETLFPIILSNDPCIEG